MLEPGTPAVKKIRNSVFSQFHILATHEKAFCELRTKTVFKAFPLIKDFSLIEFSVSRSKGLDTTAFPLEPTT